MIINILNKLKFRNDPIKYCRSIGVSIGENCSIMGTWHPFGTEPYLIKLGDHVRVNSGCHFITHDGSVWVLRILNGSMFEPCKDIEDLSDIDIFGRIEIGNNVQIGSNVIILPNVSIGDNVIVGAGAIVTKNIPDNSVAAGVPARVIESLDDYYKKNKEKFVHTKNLLSEEKKKYLYNYFGLYK